MFSKVLFAAAALVAVATAQTSVTSTASVTQVMPASATTGFNAGLVPANTTQSWCRSQVIQCPLICGGFATTNTCNTTGLSYACVCSNGTTPDVTAYRFTLPFYICQETFIQCIASAPDNSAGQQVCTANQKCGNLTAVNAATISSSASTASATGAATGSSASASGASTAAASSTSRAAAPGNTNGNSVATGALVAVLAAAMRLVL